MKPFFYFLFAIWTANAVSGTPEPARVLIFLEARADAAAQCKTLLKQYEKALHQRAPGARIEILQETDRPTRFVILESAASESELASAETGARPEWAPLNELLIAPPDQRKHRDFNPAPEAVANATNIYVIAHLDIGPPDLARGQAALNQFVQTARGAAGNVFFQVWQQTNRPNHFNLVAAWSSSSRFDEFASGAATREYRLAVTPLIGSLYDERLYHRID